MRHLKSVGWCEEKQLNPWRELSCPTYTHNALKHKSLGITWLAYSSSVSTCSYQPLQYCDNRRALARTHADRQTDGHVVGQSDTWAPPVKSRLLSSIKSVPRVSVGWLSGGSGGRKRSYPPSSRLLVVPRLAHVPSVRPHRSSSSHGEEEREEVLRPRGFAPQGSWWVEGFLRVTLWALLQWFLCCLSLYLLVSDLARRPIQWFFSITSSHKHN